MVNTLTMTDQNIHRTILEVCPNTFAIINPHDATIDCALSKYLGEPRDKPGNVVAGISVCQGYDANKTMALLLEWKGFRRLYMYAMTENLKSIMRRWTKVLFTDEVKRRLGVTERQVCRKR